MSNILNHEAFISNLKSIFRIENILIDVILDEGFPHYLIRFYKLNIPYVISNPWFSVRIYHDLYLPISDLKNAIIDGISKAISEDIHSL